MAAMRLGHDLLRLAPSPASVPTKSAVGPLESAATAGGKKLASGQKAIPFELVGWDVTNFRLPVTGWMRCSPRRLIS